MAPDIRIINLETAITTSDDFWPGKGIHYRMNPQNVDCIWGAKIDCCAIANNHILDWGYAGLSETLTVLRQSGVKTAGAGMNIAEAAAPAILEIPGKGRVLLFAFGSESSGIPVVWGAAQDRAGINLLEDLSIHKIERIGQSVEQVAREGDIVVASIHWGPNWGYEVTRAESDFAHALIDDARVDLIFGHSSHHVKRIENYRGRLILFGCGDFLDDYEGISGYEQFRGDLGLMYFVSVEPSTGKFSDLQMIPTQMRRMSVRRARATDVSWMKNVINRESGEFGINVDVSEYRGFPSLGLACQ